MPVWFTAEFRLGHSKIIGYRDRPIRDVAAMNDELAGRWNYPVVDTDTVWVLGGPTAEPSPRAASERRRGHRWPSAVCALGQG